MAEYQFWQHKISGEVWAVRLEDGKVTGYCGVLSKDRGEIDPALLPDFHYDDQDETREECAEWWGGHADDYMLYEPKP